jgi:hypothetical protein
MGNKPVGPEVLIPAGYRVEPSKFQEFRQLCKKNDHCMGTVIRMFVHKYIASGGEIINSIN